MRKLEKYSALVLPILPVVTMRLAGRGVIRDGVVRSEVDGPISLSISKNREEYQRRP